MEQWCPYQVSQAIELLSKQTRRPPPPRHFSVEKVKHEPSQGKGKRPPQTLVIVGYQVMSRREDGKGATDAVHNRDEVSQPKIPTRWFSMDRLMSFEVVPYLTIEK